jgi:nucleoside recognition membrane protein YjiH
MEFFNQSFWQGVVASLAVVILVALLTPIKNMVVDYLNRRKLKKYEQKLNMLAWEKKHLTEVRNSSVALNRAVYSDIFYLLLFLSLGLGLPTVGSVVASMNPLFDPVVKFLLPFSVPVWGASLTIAIQNIKKFDNLSNYAKAIDKLDMKISSVGEKIKASSPK